MNRTKKKMTGNHRRKLDQKIRSSRESAFNENWEEKYDQKYEYLVKNREKERQNYSPDNEMAELDPFYGTYLEGTKLEDKIKFSDVEIEKEEEKRGEKAKNYVVLGTIVPPLTKEEIFVLELDPKLAIESQITKEDISIAVEEGKVKRMWGQMNEVNDVLEDGTVEEATPEERLRAEEQENELRRLSNYDTKTFDFTHCKSTDTKFNRRTFLPRRSKAKTESEEMLRRNKIMNETEDWMKTNCDVRGNQLKTNISSKMKKGIKALKERTAKGEVVVCHTDKSGKFAIMPLETYTKMGSVHTANDRKASEEDLNEIQREVNHHVRMLLKVFNVGAIHGDNNEDRCRSGFTSSAACPPVLSLMVKDHKKIQEGQPVPSRPVVGILDTVISRLSNLITTVIRTIADNMDGTAEVKSGENLKSKIVGSNRRLKIEAVKDQSKGCLLYTSPSPRDS